MFEKKKTTTSITFFEGFVTKNGDNTYRRLFQWFCCEKNDGSNIIAFFYGGGVVKKVMATCGFFFFL